jgi:hypothetical protein
MNKGDKRRLLKEAKKERIVAKKHYENAGFLFEQIKMLRHAASCFFTAQNCRKAAEIFERLECYGQAAECLMQIHDLSRAAQLYERANLVTRAIECYEANGDWEQLLHCLHRNKEFFKLEERQSLINKYVPVALNTLYKLYSQENDSEDEESGEAGRGEANRGKLQEMKIRLKYQNKGAQVIAEEDDEDEEDEDDEEQEEEPDEEEPENGEAAEEEIE